MMELESPAPTVPPRSPVRTAGAGSGRTRHWSSSVVRCSSSSPAAGRRTVLVVACLVNACLGVAILMRLEGTALLRPRASVRRPGGPAIQTTAAIKSIDNESISSNHLHDHDNALSMHSAVAGHETSSATRADLVPEGPRLSGLDEPLRPANNASATTPPCKEEASLVVASGNDPAQGQRTNEPSQQQQQQQKEQEQNQRLPPRDGAAAPVANATAKADEQTPWLVLHVGPGKTGTSSIQYTLNTKRSKSYLGKDDYKYIGNNGGVLKRSESYQCVGSSASGTPTGGGDDDDDDECTRTLSPGLVRLLRNEKNLVGSSEFLAALGLRERQAWADATANRRRVRVVVSYRRLFELLPSKYNQRYKYARVPNQKTVVGHRDWPGVGGNIKIPNFAEHLHAQDLTSSDKHPFVRTYKDWSQNFDVLVFNVHQEGDMTTNFMCHVIPGARKLCKELMKETKDSKNKAKQSNTSTSYIDYDMLAVHAHEQGLVHPSDNRYELTQAMQEHHERHGREEAPLPLVCPSAEQLQELYDLSLASENYALGLPAAETSSPPTDFEAGWEATLAASKLCSVDAGAALSQGFWRGFFRDRLEARNHFTFTRFTSLRPQK